jgi:hypothetical protein
MARGSHMKKAVFVVRVDNYFPELCQYTIPSIKLYAKNIGADYREITTRMYPDFPPTYEKMQIHHLGRGYDVCMLSDADNILHPDCIDLSMFAYNRVGSFSAFDSRTMFEQDTYFKRDERNLGVATGFVITHALTHDAWTPLEWGWEEARKKTKREFIIDEYCVSRNIAKYGLKFVGLNYDDSAKKMFYHMGVEGIQDKKGIVEKAKQLYEQWAIGGKTND